MKFLAPAGKRRFADILDYNGIIALDKEFPGKKANRFIEWFTNSGESIDGKSKTKVYALYESSFILIFHFFQEGLVVNWKKENTLFTIIITLFSFVFNFNCRMLYPNIF